MPQLFRHVLAAGLAACCITLPDSVRAQPAWRPEKPVEIILPTSAGGLNDQMARLVQKGQARMLAVLAPQRQSGPLANVPTLKEQGFDVAGVTNWRGMFGPRGLTEAQIDFWEDAMAKVVAIEEWQKPMEQNHLAQTFLRGRDFVKFLENEYQASRAALTDLGFAK